MFPEQGSQVSGLTFVLTSTNYSHVGKVEVALERELGILCVKCGLGIFGASKQPRLWLRGAAGFLQLSPGLGLGRLQFGAKGTKGLSWPGSAEQISPALISSFSPIWAEFSSSSSSDHCNVPHLHCHGHCNVLHPDCHVLPSLQCSPSSCQCSLSLLQWSLQRSSSSCQCSTPHCNVPHPHCNGHCNVPDPHVHVPPLTAMFYILMSMFPTLSAMFPTFTAMFSNLMSMFHLSLQYSTSSCPCSTSHCNILHPHFHVLHPHVNVPHLHVNVQSFAAKFPILMSMFSTLTAMFPTLMSMFHPSLPCPPPSCQCSPLLTPAGARGAHSSLTADGFQHSAISITATHGGWGEVMNPQTLLGDALPS